MRLVSWCRADLRRPEVPTGVDERAFHVAAPLVALGVAQVTDPGSFLDLALLLPAVAGFVLRGVRTRFPAEAFALLVLVPLVVVVGRRGDLEAALFLAPTLVLYTAWSLRSVIRATAVLAGAVAVPAVVAVVLVPEAGITWSIWAVASVLLFVLGRTLQRQRDLIAELEATRRELASRAVAEERRRIARELHDLAGHTLAAMLLHVTGARHVLRRDVDEADRALADAEAVGRRSLGQIRATVAALRADEAGTDAALADLADLVPLVEDFRRAGLDVALVGSASPEAVDGPTATALHRITREALTNCARHAPGNRVEVAVATGPSQVHLVVTDAGRRPAGRADPAAPHFGLVGMAERARALGGELQAGPTDDGWRVAATLPRPRAGIG